MAETGDSVDTVVLAIPTCGSGSASLMRFAGVNTGGSGRNGP